MHGAENILVRRDLICSQTLEHSKALEIVVLVDGYNVPLLGLIASDRLLACRVVVILQRHTHVLVHECEHAIVDT